MITPRQKTALVEAIAKTRNATEPIAGTIRMYAIIITITAVKSPKVIGIEKNA